MRLTKPVYESLPWVYMVLGLLAVASSFGWRAPFWSEVLAGVGVVSIIGGLVLVLRRRDFRIQKRRYGANFDDEDED